MGTTPPGDGWRPIAEAPRDATRIEVYAPSMGVSSAKWIDGAGQWVEDIGSGFMGGYMTPFQDWTHWRPDPGEAMRTHAD